MLHWRQEQLGVMDAAIRTAGSGAPTVLLVEGDAGTGKTSVLDELAVRAAGFTVLESGAFESAADYPFGVLEQWGVQHQPGAPTPPYLGAQLINEVLDGHTEGPVLLLLDDLHWADPESVDALVWMLQRASGDRLLVAISSRTLAPDVHPGWQRWAAARGHVVELRVEGLDLEQTGAVVREQLPQLGEPTIRDLWQHTGGNPSYLTAMLAEYDASDLLRLRSLPAPRAFSERVRTRLARLPDESVSLLQAAAVLGSGWHSLIDVGQLAGVEHPGDVAQPLIDHSVLRERELDSGVAVRLSQPVLRAAVYDQIPLADRRALHARAATLVSIRDDVLGHQIAAVEQYDDDLAAEVEQWAAELHGYRLHRAAARYLRSASWLSSDLRDRERRWLDSLFESVLAQDTPAVRAVALEVEEASDVMRRDLVLGALATFEDDNHEAIYWFKKELSADESEGLAEPAIQYRIEVLLAWARLQAGEPTELVARGLARAAAIAEVDPGLAGWRLAAEGMVSLRTRPALEVLHQFDDMSENPVAVPWGQRFHLSWRGDVRAVFGLVRGAIGDLDHLLSLNDEGDLEAAVPHHQALLGLAYWLNGDWGRAAVHLRLGQELGASLSPFAVAVAPLVEIGAGSLTTADELIERAEGMLGRHPWVECVELLQAVRVARRHADPSSAARASTYDDMRVRLPSLLAGQEFTHPVWLSHAALAACWAEALDDAESCVLLMTTTCSSGAAWIPAMAHWIRGLVQEQRGNDQLAVGHLEAATADSQNDLPFYRAHMLVDHARVALAVGDAITAERCRAQALDLYARLGADGYADRVGTAHRATQPRTPGLLHHLGLTEREQDVLTLLASGLSYAQIARDLFVSQSTVSYHLSNIYRKAQVGSRHELTELVRGDPVGFGLRSS
jgi:DNA-binding CsgD family transcriptional regulator